MSQSIDCVGAEARTSFGQFSVGSAVRRFVYEKEARKFEITPFELLGCLLDEWPLANFDLQVKWTASALSQFFVVLK